MEGIVISIIVSTLTGFLTAVFSFTILYYYVQKRFKHKAEQMIDEYILLFKEKLKQGFYEAGNELLPKFKQEVKDGFKEAINESLGPAIIDETAKKIAKTSSSIIQNSINLLTGRWEDEK